MEKKRAGLAASPGEQSLSNIPLPVGQEAKGLVLPDFDLEGHLRGKFEAGEARRIDEEHVGFHGLKITTYTARQQARPGHRNEGVGPGSENASPDLERTDNNPSRRF